ncbi:nucleobase:cation symporter-2, NCS2 family [Cetobacterium ceti]|uniref:Nucleobase:cation symporter-2, NCS2 family n=1 Tax=Cetobacterium ceti TaxID=180163 RepID=A0A1T4LZL4_9FUSO|nr:nucleobase:cation symporter-2 family protein [Cetobacterium ceti]SJZ60087.1 nucleobase:cation symporter-2, NCS2 family [Cetobacterium ceti]
MENKLVLQVDEKPGSLSTWVLLSLQHIFAAFSGIVTVPIIFGSSLGFNTLEMGEIISDMLIVSGVITIFQCYGFGKFGSKLPQVMGSNFTFIGPGLAIGGAAIALNGGSPQGAYGAILGASLIGALVQTILGSFTDKLREIFPPVVQGCVVSLIGMTIIGVAVDWFAGGFGAPDYGSPSNLLLGFSVLAITIFLNQYGRGIFSSGAIFFGILSGYIIAGIMGKLDLSPILSAGYIHLPRPLKYGMEFKIQYIIPFVIAYLVALVESTGDTLACGKVCGVDMEKEGERLKGALMWGGMGSFVGALFNVTPTTTFSQNTGIVSLTGVASRWVVMGSGILLVLMGFFPKFSALVAVMPNPVLGGAGVVMFGMIAAVGIGIFREVDYTKGNMIIVGISISAGLAVTLKPEVLSKLPEFVRTILSSGITTGTLVAVFLSMMFTKFKGGEQ